jgi:hypothetical protein
MALSYLITRAAGRFIDDAAVDADASSSGFSGT